MRIIDRFDAYMAYAHLTDNKVTNQLGLTNGVIGKSRRVGRDLSDRVVELIENYYTDLNIDWLKTGTGDMLKGPVELLADRISEVYTDLSTFCYEKGEYVARVFGMSQKELSDFTSGIIYPSKPFDFVKFNKEYPEYNHIWILTGVGDKFTGDEETCIRAIKDRTYHKNHPEFFPNENKSKVEEPQRDDSQLWDQINFQNEQLKEKDAQIREKDAQINKLLDALPKK